MNSRSSLPLAWEVIPALRPFLSHEQWVKLRNLGKARINEPGLSPRTKAQRQELYWFLLIPIGAAGRRGLPRIPPASASQVLRMVQWLLHAVYEIRHRSNDAENDIDRPRQGSRMSTPSAVTAINPE
jgi:hypothetical protein